ncbi:MAG: ROK family protein [Anaerolineae bacterium]|nr:ROK family protein [Anaerolineae bacterium]
MQPRIHLALDFGGTKLAAALIDLTDGSILAEERCLTPSAQGAQACVNAMLDLGDRLMEQAMQQRWPVAAAGISFGGPVSRDRTTCVKSQHVTGWDQYPMVDIVQKHYRLPADMDNDANLAALGSWYYDANHQPENFFYVQASTGIGGGLVLGRKLYRGGGIAAEIGHFFVEGNTIPCVCGNTGCLETLCAGWGLAALGQEVYQRNPHSQYWQEHPLHNPAELTAESVIAAARGGDRPMRELVGRCFTSFGIALSHAIALTDVEQVILGGGLFRSHDVLFPILLPVIERHLPPYMKGRCAVKPSTLNGRETLLGAALLSIAD